MRRTLVILSLTIVSCGDISIRSIDDLEGIYISPGCPDIKIDKNNIYIESKSYPYKIVKLKDYYAMDMEKTISYIDKEKCELVLSNLSLYIPINKDKKASIAIPSSDMKYDRFFYKE